MCLFPTDNVIGTKEDASKIGVLARSYHLTVFCDKGVVCVTSVGGGASTVGWAERGVFAQG